MSVILYQYKPVYGLLNASPFCMKVELFLKLAGIKYKTEILKNPSKAPHKKLPFIEHEGKTIADSRFILPYLSEKFKVNFDSGLSEYERGVSKLIERTFDDGLYWEIYNLRFVDNASWKRIKQEMLAGVPSPLCWIIRRQALKQQWAQGVGRLPQSQVIKLGADTIHAVSQVLSDKFFMLGDRLTTADITAYSYLANIGCEQVKGPLYEVIIRYDNLRDYLQRMSDVVEGKGREQKAA